MERLVIFLPLNGSDNGKNNHHSVMKEKARTTTETLLCCFPLHLCLSYINFLDLMLEPTGEVASITHVQQTRKLMLSDADRCICDHKQKVQIEGLKIKSLSPNTLSLLLNHITIHFSSWG